MAFDCPLPVLDGAGEAESGVARRAYRVAIVDAFRSRQSFPGIACCVDVAGPGRRLVLTPPCACLLSAAGMPSAAHRTQGQGFRTEAVSVGSRPGVHPDHVHYAYPPRILKTRLPVNIWKMRIVWIPGSPRCAIRNDPNTEVREQRLAGRSRQKVFAAPGQRSDGASVSRSTNRGETARRSDDEGRQRGFARAPSAAHANVSTRPVAGHSSRRPCPACVLLVPIAPRTTLIARHRGNARRHATKRAGGRRRRRSANRWRLSEQQRGLEGSSSGGGSAALLSIHRPSHSTAHAFGYDFAEFATCADRDANAASRSAGRPVGRPRRRCPWRRSSAHRHSRPSRRPASNGYAVALKYPARSAIASPAYRVHALIVCGHRV